MVDLLESFIRSLGSAGYPVVVALINIVPVKLAALLLGIRGADWLSCALVSIASAALTYAIVYFAGGVASFAGVFVQAGLIAAIIGAGFLKALIASVIAAVLTAIPLFAISYYMAEIV